MTRLNALVTRDGAMSAARQLSAEPGLLGELRGREGLFAGAKWRAERQAAIRAAAAIGPNVTRLAEAETEAAQGYRASVAAQLKADRTAIPNLSANSDSIRPGIERSRYRGGSGDERVSGGME